MLATAEAPATTLGQDIDELFELREHIRALEEDLKKISAGYEKKRDVLLARLQVEGLPKASGRKATVSVSELVVADVENWEEFHAYIHRNKAYHLLERRVANAAYRELLASRKRPVPGVKPYTKHTLKLLTL